MKDHKLYKKNSVRSLQIDDKIYVWDDIIAFIDKNTGKRLTIQECRDAWKNVKDKWKRRGWEIDYDTFYELFAAVYDESHY